MERAGFYQAIQILEKNWDDEKLVEGYIVRHRDLSNAIRHSVDMSDPQQRILSMLLDESQFPQFSSEYYPFILEEMARTPELIKIVSQPPEEKEIYLGQILSIMSATGITFAEISDNALHKKSLRLRQKSDALA
jgi:hypothetical protein